MATDPIFEKIQQQEVELQKLRQKAIGLLESERAELLKKLDEIDAKIASYGGEVKAPAERQAERKKITIEAIKAAILKGADNYRKIADALGCSVGSVSNRIKQEGKKAGIRHEGEKAKFRLFIT